MHLDNNTIAVDISGCIQTASEFNCSKILSKIQFHGWLSTLYRQGHITDPSDKW